MGQIDTWLNISNDISVLTLSQLCIRWESLHAPGIGKMEMQKLDSEEINTEDERYPGILA